MLEECQAQRVERAKRATQIFPVRWRRRFLRNVIKQAVEVKPIHAKAGRKPSKHTRPVILREVLRQRKAGVSEMVFRSPIGTACPIGRVEQLAIGGNRFDAGQPIRRAAFSLKS